MTQATSPDWFALGIRSLDLMDRMIKNRELKAELDRLMEESDYFPSASHRFYLDNLPGHLKQLKKNPDMGPSAVWERMAGFLESEAQSIKDEFEELKALKDQYASSNSD